jgi:hypothetical protein
MEDVGFTVTIVGCEFRLMYWLETFGFEFVRDMLCISEFIFVKSLGCRSVVLGSGFRAWGIGYWV